MGQASVCPAYVGKSVERKVKKLPHKGKDCIILRDPADGKTLAVVCYKHASMIESLVAEMKAADTGEDVETIEILRVGIGEMVGHAEREYVCCVK